MGQLIEYIKMALDNIRANKGRSILTMLGIIIGISSVIMIIAIGNGAKGTISDELNAMAGGQIYIHLDSNKNKDGLEFGIDDFEAIEEKVEHVKAATPSYTLRGTARSSKGEFDCYVSAGTAGLEYTVNQPVSKGRYFSKDDYEAGKKVCIMTEGDARKLFGTTDVIGMTVEVTMYNVTQEMTIVALRADSAAGALSAMMSSDRISIEIPISVLGSSYGFYVNGFTEMLIVAESPSYATQVAQSSINLLEGRMNIRGENLLMIENFNDYVQQYDTILNMLTIFIAFVAAISLLVGGIGVMNIMLVSVTERTREIGIRKALGARTRSIMTQFLAESAIITLLGGIVGIFLGFLGASGISALGSGMGFAFTPQIGIGTILAATLFSSGVGLFFGIYPAKKAAKLSPIEALRHE